MQIVININESDYKTLIINGGNCSISMAERIIDSVFQGKKLPKGHGRLIDADELNRMMYHKSFELDSDMQKWDSGCWIRYKMFENSMEEMLTIIEADAESEGKA